MEEMATQATALVARAHSAEKELKKVQVQLITVRQAKHEAKLQANQLVDQKEKEITKLQAALAKARRRELNPGEFGEVLIHKFVKTKDFYIYAVEMWEVSMNIGR